MGARPPLNNRFPLFSEIHQLFFMSTDRFSVNCHFLVAQMWLKVAKITIKLCNRTRFVRTQPPLLFVRLARTRDFNTGWLTAFYSCDRLTVLNYIL